ncbi:MAG: helix-turn-helix transcriptional regulator [Rhizobacter sp.]
MTTPPSAASPPLLGEFVRNHRERITPQSVGLPPGFRRRAKGLRREELAALCGISPTWLTWIEQGRALSLSAGTLAALAKALSLNPAERAYLFDLAALRDPASGGVSPGEAAAAALRSSLADAVAKFRSPAYVLDADWNAIAWNKPAAALFDGWLGKGATERNLLTYMFLDPGARTFIDDWPERARRLVAEFRADRRSGLQEKATKAQVAALRRGRPQLDPVWSGHDVLAREGGERVFLHSVQGRVALRQLTLQVANSPDHKVVLLC